MVTDSATIIVPCWQGGQYLSRLVEGLKADPEQRVIFVDNGSTDGSSDFLRKVAEESYNFRLISNEHNMGYTQGVNAGILACDTDVILLNQDIEITDPDWVSKLRAVAEQDNVGVVIPRLQDFSGRLNTTHSYLSYTHQGYPLPCIGEDYGQYSETEEIESGTFAVVYLTRDCLNHVGLLEENLLVYGSDSLFCLFARGLGYRVMRAGNVTLKHAVGSSVQRPEFDYAHNIERDTKVLKKIVPTVRNFSYKCNLIGVMGHSTGYGHLTWNIGRALRKVGVDVRAWPVTEPRSQVVDGPMFADCISLPDIPTADTIYVGTPDRMKLWGTGKRVCVSMLETTNCPPEFVEPLNEIDEFWTFSEFNRHSFGNNGVTTKTIVIPPPLDTELLNPGLRPYRLPQAREYNIVAVFEWGERKFVEWIKYALEAFRGHHDVALHLRCFEGNPGIKRTLAEYAQDYRNTVTVRWVMGQIPVYEMGSFYKGADLVVCIGAEGIGMPLLEATACDVPTLSFHWGAGGEYAEEYASVLCEPIALVEAKAQCPYYRDGMWGYPDWYHFQRGLLYAYHHREEMRLKAQEAGQRLRERFNLRAVGSAYLAALMEGADAIQ